MVLTIEPQHIIILVIITILLLIKCVSFFYKQSYREKERNLIQIETTRRKDYDVKLNELERKVQSLKKREQSLEKWFEHTKQAFAQKSSELLYREAHINAQVRQRIAETVEDLTKRDYISSSPVFCSLMNNSGRSRLTSSLSQNMQLQPPFNISSRIKGASGELYDVTLYTCTCKDYLLHRQPCKHMYRLAAEVGALLAYDTDALREQVLSLNQQVLNAEALISDSKNIQHMAKKEMDAAQKLLTETSQSYPWLAKLYADAVYALDGSLEKELREKRRAAASSADKVNIIKKEKRQLQAQCKSLEYQLHFYETIFPWLEEFKETPPLEAFQSQQAVSDDNFSNFEYASLRKWLSPEEYRQLSDAEKFQLALDRYRCRNKSNWEAGIEYERYIGYLCEQHGYRVDYTGARLGLEDMGRDLVLSKDNAVYIIQCKRWAKEKLIHEKHIFQLYGSCILHEAQDEKQRSVKGVFVTTTTLSPLARQCAERLNILCYENVPFGDYPIIKCNISRSEEKIYHLPFDQQYDRVIISPERGEFYASTIAQAESAGFRRALRHNPTQQS